MFKQDPNKLSYVGRIDPNNRDFYGTPPEWVEMCRKVMGSIELDPASCVEANDAVIKADRFYNEVDNALEQPWDCDTLFLNPPYSNRAGKKLQKFAEKFYSEWSSGVIGQAIILVNNTTETKAFGLFSDCASLRAETCKRINFIGVDGRSNCGNTKGQVFFYCGRRRKRFARVFRAAGCRIVCEVQF